MEVNLKGKKDFKSAKNKNEFKFEDVVVEIQYSDNNKTFYECILNILKQKKKMG